MEFYETIWQSCICMHQNTVAFFKACEPKLTRMKGTAGKCKNTVEKLNMYPPSYE